MLANAIWDFKMNCMHVVGMLPSSTAAICRAIRLISSEAGTLAVGATSDGAAAAACSLQTKVMLVHLLHAVHHSNT